MNLLLFVFIGVCVSWLMIFIVYVVVIVINVLLFYLILLFFKVIFVSQEIQFSLHNPYQKMNRNQVTNLNRED